MGTLRPFGPRPPGARGAPRIRIFLPGTELGRRFDVVDVLGSGASGVVYAAVERSTGRELALKVFRQERLSERAVERLKRELAIVRAAASPRFVAPEEIGRSGDAVYATSERIAGTTLRQRLAEGPLPLAEALRVATGVLEALAELHALGVLHRDLKPGNVFLAEDGRVKLSDFGLGRTWERESSGEASIAYLAPEQATGGHVDAPSDLYSAGVLLYEMLTGRVPLKGGSTLGTAVARLKERAPDVRAARPDAPEWLARVLRRLLATDAADRYAAAAEVLEDLRRRRARAPRRHLVPERSWVGALVAVAIAVSFLLWNRYANPRFSRLVFDEEAGLRAVDADGRLLWSRSDLARAQDAWPIRVRRRAPDQVAVLLTRGHETDPDYTRFLIFLDADSGAVVRGVFLPDLAPSFPGLPNAYRASVAAVDLDANGRDDLLVTYDNVRAPGSYTLLYDPRRDESHPVFLSTGTQSVIGTADVDGDGRREVLLASVNEGWGGTAAVAAVRVPPEGAFPAELGAEALAASPDRDHPRGIAGLAFYALLPSASLPLATRIVPDARSVEIDRAEGGPLLLGFDGFLRGDRSTRGAGERNAARARAFDRLREAARLVADGYAAPALPQVEGALADVAAAEDRTLGEWSVRLHAVALAGAGRGGEAEAELVRLSERSDLAVPIARDAARAFHLAGEPAAAVRWYRRGLGAPKGGLAAPRADELLEGLVLALGEMRRWDDAVAEVDRWTAADPLRSGSIGVLRAWALYRATGRIDREPPFPAEGTELARALSLELRAAAEETPEPLIPAVSAEIARARTTRPLLESLRAVLLSHAGRWEEAFGQARVAWWRARTAAPRDVVAHATQRLVASRYALVLREARVSARGARPR